MPFEGIPDDHIKPHIRADDMGEGSPDRPFSFSRRLIERFFITLEEDGLQFPVSGMVVTQDLLCFGRRLTYQTPGFTEFSGQGA